MRGGCTEYRNSRRDHVSEGSFSESSEPSHSGVDDWTAKNLEYGLGTANSV